MATNTSQQPALLGGLFIGVLSALPFVNGANAAAASGSSSGGLLAAYLQQQESAARPIDGRCGRLGGLLAGAIGAVITSPWARCCSRH